MIICNYNTDWRSLEHMRFIVYRQWGLCPDPSPVGLYGLTAEGKTKPYTNLTAKSWE